MKYLLIICAMTLAGCNTLVSQAPTMQNCHKVQYERINSDVKLYLECNGPYAGEVK